MWRSTAGAVGGLIAACAVAIFLVFLGMQITSRSFDLSWMYSTKQSFKQDRLPVARKGAADEVVMAFHVPAEATTVVAKGNAPRRTESGLQLPREPVRPTPVREVPSESKRENSKQRPLEGCEPSFSPVIVPALAHVASRCLS